MGKGGSFDFKQLKQIQKQLEGLQKEQERFQEECVKELAARLLAKIVKRTPVGRPPKLDGSRTVKVKGADGRTRSFPSKKGMILQKYWAGYQGGTLRRGWTAGAVQKRGDSYEIEIINPSEYASYVEYGHRQKPGRYVPALGKKLKSGWTPGRFMMTISMRELEEQAPAVLERNLAVLLGRALDVK